MIRILSLVVAMLSAVSAAVGCGGSAPAESTTPSASDTSAQGEAPASDTADSAASATAPSAAAAASDAAGDADGDGISDDTEFKKDDSGAAKEAYAAHASKIKPTATEAAVRLLVVDKDKGPIAGVVSVFTSPTGAKYYAEETDAAGYTEVLLPVGKDYEITYLSLGRKDIAAKVNVPNQPELTLKLTLRYKRIEPPAQPRSAGARTPAGSPRFVLSGVEFETGKATLLKDSLAKLESVIEYMTHRPSVRIEISGHTDNVGNPKANQILSTKRAEAVRKYLGTKGIAAKRIDAVGYGDTLPIEPNDTEEGRAKNRRIEATEL